MELFLFSEPNSYKVPTVLSKNITEEKIFLT